MANENMKNPFRLLLNVLHRLLDDKADTEYVDRKIDEVCKDVSLGVSEAVVGQTVQITEVDEDGKPTKWGSADIPAQTDIDSTLSIEGAAADAKAVGDKLTEVSGAIADHAKTYVLKDGETMEDVADDVEVVFDPHDTDESTITEEWQFTLVDGSVVTKKVVLGK